MFNVHDSNLTVAVRRLPRSTECIFNLLFSAPVSDRLSQKGRGLMNMRLDGYFFFSNLCEEATILMNFFLALTQLAFLIFGFLE